MSQPRMKKSVYIGTLVLTLFAVAWTTWSGVVWAMSAATCKDVVGGACSTSQPTGTDTVGDCGKDASGNSLTCYATHLSNAQCNSADGRNWRNSACNSGETPQGVNWGYFSSQVCCKASSAALSTPAPVTKPDNSTTQCFKTYKGTCKASGTSDEVKINDSASGCTSPDSCFAKVIGDDTACKSAGGDKGCKMPATLCTSTGGTVLGACVTSGITTGAYAGVCCKGGTSSDNGGPGNGTGATDNGGPGNGTGSGTNGGGTASINFPNPLTFNTFQDFFTGVLSYLQGIIVLLALLFIVIGGVMYITSAGDDKRITAAKATITAAMIGLAIGIAAPTFLKEIAKILGWSGNQTAISGAPALSTIILNALNFLLGVTGVLAIIMLVIGGFMYLTAAGDEKRVDTAKDIVKNSIFGIVIVLSALIIVKQIAAFFS